MTIFFFFKMVPSVDPLPFKVFLGYKRYPTYTDFVAMAEMPLQGANLGEQSVFYKTFLNSMLRG